MKTILTYAAVSLAALAISISASPATGADHRPEAHAKTIATEVTRTRGAIEWHRARTWHWQDLSDVRRTPTNHAELRTRSVAYLRWLDRLWSGRRVRAKRHLQSVLSRSDTAAVPIIIRYVFGARNTPEAVHIAWGESRFVFTAWNSSDHGGLFQLGTLERSEYATIGYSTAYEQTVAAHNLFLARGWEPWTCCGE